MTSVTIRQCTVEEIQNAPNIDALMDEYAAESHVAELPAPNVQWGHYKAMEDMGTWQVFGAFIDATLIGFISVVSNKLPHHGATVAITESFFVAREHRKTGVGLKLLRSAEQNARNVGSPCLLVNAPHGSSLDSVMPRIGYRHTSTVYCRSLR